jgi:hypothetical protein
VPSKLNNEHACGQGLVEAALCLLKVMVMIIMIVMKSAREIAEECTDSMWRSREITE